MTLNFKGRLISSLIFWLKCAYYTSRNILISEIPVRTSCKRIQMTDKKIAIVQSSYIPWKGYFDLINRVDKFVLYDDAQYTKNDWRNRNRIKSPSGLMWLTIPVRHTGRFGQKICQVEVADRRWARKHWNSIKTCYGKARYFEEMEPFFMELFQKAGKMDRLSQINLFFIREICGLMGINTKLTFSMNDTFSESPENNGDKNEKLIAILLMAGANVYLSGPAAASYLDESLFEKNGISVKWMDYNGYPKYEQLHPPFEHGVSIVDVLMNVGAKDAPKCFFAADL